MESFRRPSLVPACGEDMTQVAASSMLGTDHKPSGLQQEVSLQMRREWRGNPTGYYLKESMAPEGIPKQG